MWRVLKKIENIVREEMDASGAQEILMPIVQPKELWEESGRWEVYGKELMRLSDRHDREFCLGPTHEELFTMVAKSKVQSFKDLPFSLYQIQTKFRDEARPRYGLIRLREFVMKDNGESDYLLFVNGKAIGVLEAKKAELSLSGVENQSQGYACNLPEGVRYYQMPLPFVYESNGSEIYFRDCRDKVCRSRRLFAFHKPETLLELISNEVQSSLSAKIFQSFL